MERPVPSYASCLSHGSASTSHGSANLTLSAVQSPSPQELCHQRPAHLALKDTRNTAGRAKLSEQSTMKLVVAGVASNAACSSYGMTFFRFLLCFAEKY